MSASDHLNPVQFYHGTDARLSRGDLLVPQVANESDYSSTPVHPGQQPVSVYGEEKEFEHPHTYVTTRVATAARYGSRVYKVEIGGDVKPDATMDSVAESYKTDAPVRVTGRMPYRPPKTVFDRVSLRKSLPEGSYYG